MSLPQVARCYARALHETARDTGDLPRVVDDMAALSKLFQDLPDVLAWCRGGDSHDASAGEFVRTAFLPVVGPLTGRTLQLAAANGRLYVIPLLPPAFDAELAAQSPTVRVTLETAQPPDDELVALIGARVAQRTGRHPEVVSAVVPALVGGFRAFWQSRLWDCSARARLAALRRRLTRAGGPP